MFVNSCAGASVEVLPARYLEAILLNVPNNGISPSAIRSAKWMLRWTQAKWSILDSGGFQLYEAQRKGKKITFDPSKPIICTDTLVNLTPRHDVDVAIEIQPNIMIALDFPIRKIPDPEERELEFMEKLGPNARFARETSKLRAMYCPNIKLFLPVQAYTIEQLEIFLDLIGDISYDGFSLPVRNLSPKEIFLFLVRFYQLGVRSVHLLGTSKLVTVALLAFVARHLFTFTSFDSTTWHEAAKHARYLNPHDLTPEEVSTDTIVKEDGPIDCECQFCENKSFTDVVNLEFTDRTDYLRSHNWAAIEGAKRDLYENSHDVYELKMCLMKRSKDKNIEEIDELCTALSFLEHYKDSDINTLRDILN